MQSSLDKLLNDTERGEKENFLSLDPVKKFSLSKQFWTRYDDIFTKNPPFSLLEIPQEDYSILRFDVDLYPVTKTKKRLYNHELVLFIIKQIHFLIEEASKECDKRILNPNNYICCLFEKEYWSEKDGFHLIFPNLFVNHDFQNSHFVKNLNSNTYKLSSDTSKISIDNICKKPWVIWGCRKHLNSELYNLTAVYDKSLTLLSLSGFLPSSFSINKKSSVVYGKSFSRPIFKKERLTGDVDRDYKLITEWGLLQKLSLSRCEEYDFWIEIGIILYNIGCGEERFLEMWKEFSSRCEDKYDPVVCERKWRTFSIRNVTIRSLFHYFKLDDPENFNKMVYNQNISKVYDSLFPSENISKKLRNQCIFENFHIAKIFHSKYCNDLVWAPKGKMGHWYQFNGHRWVMIYEEDLKGKINGELYEYILELLDQIILDKSADEDEKVNEYLDQNQKGLNRKLHNNNFVKQTLEASKSYFINHNFHRCLDANKYLIGCENGVLDLERNVFRYSVPDDFLGMSTGIYYQEPTETDKEELYTYLEDLFVEKELIDNVLEIIASLLVGSNDDKNIIIALGPTNAGKTQLVKLFEKTLGDYAVTFPKELVYQRSISSSSARPELARVEGKRMAFINELSKEESMNVATVKELSGNDKFFARALYHDGGEITPMFTMYLSCNEVPRIPQDDEALWGRLLIINFESTFVNNPPEERKLQLENRKFARISNLDEKFSRLAPVLLWVLFNKYIDNKKKYPKGIPKCPAIRNATQSFRESNNPVFKFICERITIDEKEGSFYKCTDLFTYYSIWYKSYFPEQKIRMNKDQFKEAFIKLSGKKIVKEKPDETSRKTEGWSHIVYGEKVDT